MKVRARQGPVEPDAAESVRLELGKWYQPDLVEHWIEGLRRAGLEILEVKREDQK
jgi:hypothetical protein